MEKLIFIICFAYLIPNHWGHQLAPPDSAKQLAPSASVKTLTSSELSKHLEAYIQDINNPEALDAPEWIISDPQINLDLFRIMKPHLLSKGQDDFEKKIREKQTFIKIKMGEKEIRNLSFFKADSLNPQYEVNDFNDILDAMGDIDYDRLKKRDYPHTKVSNLVSSEPRFGEYDLYLNLLNPYLMFYNAQNKWHLKLEGKWGDNLTINPGWFSNDQIIALTWSEYSANQQTRSLNRPRLSISAGMDFSRKNMITSNLPSKPLKSSGEGIFIKLTGRPWELFSDSISFKNIEMIISAKFNFSRYDWQSYGISDFVDVFSNKNYITFQINNKEEAIDILNFGKLQYGIGLAYYDIHHLQLNPNDQSFIDLEKDKTVIDKYRASIFGEIGVENISNIFQHDFKIFLNYEPKDKYGYIGFIFNFLITDTFGFDIKFYRTFTGKNNLPAWRTDEYFVFSPIIRISN